jgi:hypothetical protein
MCIRSMVQFSVRVAAFAAVAALLLQISCMSDLPAVTTTAHIETHSDSRCHEHAPPTPKDPHSSHICCSGAHSPDALLSTLIEPAPPISDVGASDLTSALPAFASSPTSTDFPAFSPPYKLLALRI